MLKILAVVLFLSPTYALGSHISNSAKHPLKIGRFKAKHSHPLRVGLDKPEKTPPVSFEFDKKIALFLEAYEFLCDGIYEFNRHKFEQAFSLFEAARARGSIEALYFMGAMQLSGMGTESNEQQGVKNLNEAMDNGCTVAALELGQFYLFKDNPDYEEAMAYFSKRPRDPEFIFYSGITSSADAGFKLAQQYVESLSKEQLHLHRTKHMNTANIDRFDQLIKAARAYQTGDYDRAFKYFQKAAMKGEHSAEYLYLLGHTYFAQNKPIWGLKYLQYAADLGYKPAAFDLGLRFDKGRSVKQSKAYASTYFAKFGQRP